MDQNLVFSAHNQSVTRTDQATGTLRLTMTSIQRLSRMMCLGFKLFWIHSTTDSLWGNCAFPASRTDCWVNAVGLGSLRSKKIHSSLFLTTQEDSLLLLLVKHSITVAHQHQSLSMFRTDTDNLFRIHILEIMCSYIEKQSKYLLWWKGKQLFVHVLGQLWQG